MGHHGVKRSWENANCRCDCDVSVFNLMRKPTNLRYRRNFRPDADPGLTSS